MSKRLLHSILISAMVLCGLLSCRNEGDWLDGGIVGDDINGNVVNCTIEPMCVVDSRHISGLSKSGGATRSLIDQITAKQMNANFLRLDEDLDAQNDGLYTFTASDPNTPYATNWNKAYMLEATIMSSPDDTEGIHYRSVSLSPIQSYKLNIKEDNVDGVITRDTTHFYHTRLVGWYPMTCTLPRDNGVPATAQFDFSDFNAVRINDVVDIEGVPTEVVALQFTGLDGETDLMVSDVCEGQSWHKYDADSPHRSDVHPVDGSNIYRAPFGHNDLSPTYSNYMTYRHYRSAIRLSAYAEDSPHSLVLWEQIEGAVIRNQPTSCKVWLPTRVGEFGEVYHWGDYDNLPIITTPMFGGDSNYPEFEKSVTYPISMRGSSTDGDVYLGYSLVEPNRDVELEIHTASGIYTTTISAQHTTKDEDGNESQVELFDAGCIYNVRLNLKADGTIDAILESDGDERYYDLSLLREFDLAAIENSNTISTYQISNCYIVDTSEFKDANGQDLYDGYCFLASIVGNGEAGILSSGAQRMYPESEEIKPVKAHLLWETSLGLISDIELKYGYVRFKLPDATKEGNAVIAVYDEDDNILWSWHIWITDRPLEQRFSMGEHEIVVLDRNVGATASTCSGADDALDTYGLYYQWGRKDPSMGPPTYNYRPVNLVSAPYYDFSSDEKSAAEVMQFATPTLQNGVENPMYLILPSAQTLSYFFNWIYNRYDFLWGYDSATGMTTKTIYDPCPFGYRVASSELSALFSAGSGAAGTYGYTRTVDGVDFFFPYTGYKGTDVGLNSLICSWKYVGQKGDYQSSMFCVDADAANNGGIDQYMHRSRIYVSSASSWTETNVGAYSGNLHIDFANRRTAAPVRCVKDAQIGSITATLTPSERALSPNSQITLDYMAHSYGSAIDEVTLVAIYTTSAGETITREIKHESGVGEYAVGGSVSYITPSDYDESGVVFHLIVRNEHGLLYTEEVTMVESSVEITFNRWEDALQSDITNRVRDFVVVGEDVRYYVNVSSNVEPEEVVIDGVAATKSGEFDGPAVSNTIWSIPWTRSVKGNYDMSVDVVAGGKSVSVKSTPMVVYGLTLGSPTTSIDTSGNTLYVVQNANYTSTYLTSTGTTLAANGQANYYNLFAVEGTNIRSEARGTYLNGTNGTVSFSDTATSYTIAASGNYTRISCRSGWRTYYLRQTSSTAVAVQNSSSNRNWSFIPVTYDIP